VPPTICLTLPACRSMHGRKRVIVVGVVELGWWWMRGRGEGCSGVRNLGNDLLAWDSQRSNVLETTNGTAHTNFEMAPALGKRKRVTRAELEQASRSSSPSDESAAEDMQAIFRRAFEAKFAPLPSEPRKPKSELKKPKIEEVPAKEAGQDEEEEELSDWSGISDDDDDDDDDDIKVEVVEYKDTKLDEETTKAELRAFMSSKPPTSASPSTLPAKPQKKPGDADPNELSNLKNDLDLQKLLRDSHLLSAAVKASGSSSLTATGIVRHKSADLHLQSLGAKSSVFTQKKMPMAQRKHEILKAKITEEKRRAEAKEAGIVLEKPTVSRQVPVFRKKKREVGMPSVGRFSGATLNVSKRDVERINGPPDRKKGKGGRRGGG
jgi:hypothetical protein